MFNDPAALANPRAAGVLALRRFMPPPSEGDAEALAERRLLRRMDLKEAVRDPRR